MKHEDLLEGVRSIVSDIPVDYGQYELLNALEAVINLHKPSQIPGWVPTEQELMCWCAHIYPCPTIQAIEKELQ